jgi:hypothetical protein
MAKKPHRIFPHGSPTSLAPGLWQVTGSLPFPLPRNMTIHRLPDGKLLIYSAVAMNDAGMKELDALGEVGYIVVPHPMHTMDAGFFKERYPNARVIAEPDARKKLTCVVDATADEALPGLGVRHRIVPGMKYTEVVLDLDIEGGRALVFTDLVGQGGAGSFLLKLLGPPGDFGVARIVKFRQVADKSAVKGFLEELGRTPDYRLVCSAHGRALEIDCAAKLTEAAARM